MINWPKLTHDQYVEMKNLSDTKEAKAVSELYFGGMDEDRINNTVVAYIEVAKKSKLDPFLWVIPKSKNAYSYSSVDLYGVGRRFAGGPNTLKALMSLKEAGATPWLDCISLDVKDGKYVPAQNRYRQADAFIAVEKMTKNIINGKKVDYYDRLDFSVALSMRKVLLKMAVSHLIKEDVKQTGLMDKWVEFFNKEYQSISSTSSKTAKGLLGSNDKNVKDFLGVILSLEEDLKDVNLSQKSRITIEALFKDAKERLVNKKDKKNAVVNPKKLIEDMSYPQRERLNVISDLLNRYPSDSNAAGAVIEETYWLKDHPMLASVNLFNNTSIMYAAIQCGNQRVLESLEKYGANIWLAAAQHGDANAPRFVLSVYRSHYQKEGTDAGGVIARLLLMGAWLDGAENPKETCLKLSREAIDEALKKGQNKQFAESLYASIEKEELSSLIDEFKKNQEEVPPEPVKKRRSL